MKNQISAKVSVLVRSSVAKVWDALTNPAMVKKYFFNTNLRTDWKVGSPIVFEGEWEGKSYHDKGTVYDFEPMKMFRYDYWSSMSGKEDKPENYMTLTFELSGTDDGTLVTLTQENIPDENSKKHSEQNWKMVLDAMKHLVETGKAVEA